MKHFIYIIFALLFIQCNSTKMPKNQTPTVTHIISVAEFETMVEFILNHGDRMPLRNIDNDNPTFQFKENRISLGTFGINDRNAISEYYEMIFNPFQPKKRFTLIKGEKFDANHRKLGVEKGMKSGEIYLTDVLKENIQKIKEYLKKSKEDIFLTIKNMPPKPLPIFKHVHEIKTSKLDSVVLFNLTRSGIDHYKRGEKLKKLSPQQVNTLVTILKDKQSFYGGTPMMFQFTYELVFYKADKQNSLYFSPESHKIMQNDFEIPHNKMVVNEVIEANYFPFLTEKVNTFFMELIKN
ncbi:MAG: hypothetical protein ACPGSD_04635 [Flavobacteriales bacterium]